MNTRVTRSSVRAKTAKLSAVALLSTLFVALTPVTQASASTHPQPFESNAGVGALNSSTGGIQNGSMFIATQFADDAVNPMTLHATALASSGHAARSQSGLISKDTTSATAQTATVKPGTQLALFARVSTQAAFTASGGSFLLSASRVEGSTAVATTSPAIGAYFQHGERLSTAASSTPIGVLWTAPTTPGDYTVSLNVSTAASQVLPSAGTAGTEAAKITFTVVAAAYTTVGTGINYALNAATGLSNTHLFAAVQLSTSGAAIASSATDMASTHSAARSLGLLSQSGGISTAQSTTVLAGGVLSLYAQVSSDVAFTATGGTFSGATVQNKSVIGAYSQNLRNVFIDSAGPAQASTSVAVLWTAPSSVGTYTVSMNRSNDTYQVADGLYSGTLTGAIKVTVVASSAGGKYDAGNSACDVQTMSGIATGVDTTDTFTNGSTAYIRFDLDDAYDQSLSSGNIVATATNGAFISNGANAATAAAGTGGNAVVAAAPTNRLVQVTQGTADAPVTTTVTISFDGTTVCTKTITIRGEVNKLVIGSIGTQNLSSSSGSAVWIADGTNRAGLFTVQAQDSAGNVVATNSGGSFAADSATLTTTVQALSVNNTATSTSSTSAHSAGTGLWTCGAVAGQSDVVLKWTNSGTGTVVSSPKITARCAGASYTYTASFDKAKYTQGELATLTVQFLDSKGNKANSVSSNGSLSITAPMLTAVSATDSATNLAKADGSKVYTFTVGTLGGLTEGTYTAIIDFTSLTAVAAVRATPTYTVVKGTADTPFQEVLKQVVALIASINKQIQVLQKLILSGKR